MCTEFLKEIAARPLPVRFRQQAEVDLVRLLEASGHLLAVMSPIDAPAPFATVLLLTRKGEAAVRGQHAPASDSPGVDEARNQGPPVPRATPAGRAAQDFG